MKPKHSLTPEVKGKEKPAIDPDTVLLIESTIGIVFEAFKVTVACLLSLFVPQSCDDTVETVYADGTRELKKHECTLDEQVSNLSGFNLLVFIWNFITLGVFVVHYVLVYMREAWMVEYLDEDDEFADNHLVMNDHAALKPYPGIAADLRRINYRILISSVIGGLALSVNMVISGFSLFGTYFGGFRTVTTYITNVLLIITILKTTLSNAYAGIQHHLALSCIHFEPVSYNTIDKDHIDCCKHSTHLSAVKDCEKRKPGYQPVASPAVPPNAAVAVAGNGAGDVKLDSGARVELQTVNVVVPSGSH